MPHVPRSRRQFLQAGLWSGASLLGLGRLPGLRQLGAVSAEEARLPAGMVRLRPEIEPLVRGIWRHRGQLRISRYCREVGIGERRCQRIFASALGLTPKRFARLTRFLAACSRLRQGAAVNLSRLALDCGYYDQAHFIAECRLFSGMTPSVLARADRFSFLEIE